MEKEEGMQERSFTGELKGDMVDCEVIVWWWRVLLVLLAPLIHTSVCLQCYTLNNLKSVWVPKYRENICQCVSA